MANARSFGRKEIDVNKPHFSADERHTTVELPKTQTQRGDLYREKNGDTTIFLGTAPRANHLRQRLWLQQPVVAFEC